MLRIVRDPSVRGGAPVIRGTRVAVSDILDELASGGSIAQLRRVFPLLEDGDIEAALAFARDSIDAGPKLPALSIIVVVYSMPVQAARTLRSLHPEYQRGVSAEDYEVIVVENASSKMLGEEAARAAGANVRYFARDDGEESPVGAANFGATQARAPRVALMIDGARMLTPGVVETTLAAFRVTESAAVAVPGYHLGSEVQQEAVESGYDEKVEAELLSGIGWPSDGYRLFDIACLSGSCKAGLLSSFAESNFLAMPKALFDELGGYDSRFVAPGGGYCNLDLYRRVCEHPDVTLFVTCGEGTFHQFHGGVTTGGIGRSDRQRYLEESRAAYAAIRGVPFAMPVREPRMIGRLPRNARRFLLPQGAPATPARDAPTPAKSAV